MTDLRKQLARLGIHPRYAAKMVGGTAPMEQRIAEVVPTPKAEPTDDLPTVGALCKSHGEPMGEFCVSFARAAGIRNDTTERNP